jgi:hypothetical protein
LQILIKINFEVHNVNGFIWEVCNRQGKYDQAVFL